MLCVGKNFQLVNNTCCIQIVFERRNYKIFDVRSVFGKTRLMNDGINAHVKCPSCGKGDKKKFVIRLDNDLCHCFVCGLKGRNLAPILKKFFPKYHREYCEKFLGTDMVSTGEDGDRFAYSGDRSGTLLLVQCARAFSDGRVDGSGRFLPGED